MESVEGAVSDPKFNLVNLIMSDGKQSLEYCGVVGLSGEPCTRSRSTGSGWSLHVKLPRTVDGLDNEVQQGFLFPVSTSERPIHRH